MHRVRRALGPALTDPGDDERDASERATAIYGGLAAGLAIGSKLTLVAPVLALAVCLAVLTPSRVAALDDDCGGRARRCAPAATGTCATCSRSAIRCPGLSIGIGQVRLPRPPTPSIDIFGTNLLRNLGNSRVWRDALLPGLKTGLRLGVAGHPAHRRGRDRTLGVATLRGRDLVAPLVGVVAFGAFVVTPGTVWAPS